MSLLVDVREVPWRILEAVQARILANRARKQRREEAARVRGFTRPRPQQRRMGATMSHYRAPEPVPLILDSLDAIAFAIVEENHGSTEYELTVSNADRSKSVTVTIPLLTVEYPDSDWFNGESGEDLVIEGTEAQPYKFPEPSVSSATQVEWSGLGPQEHPLSGVRTYRKQQRILASNEGSSDLFVMPCSSQALILVYRMTAYYVATVTRLKAVTISEFDYRDSIPYIDGFGEVNGTWDLYTWQVSNTHESDVLVNSDSAVIYKAFFVSPSMVKEVDVPQQFRQIIRAVSSEPEDWPVTTKTLATYQVTTGGYHNGTGLIPGEPDELGRWPWRITGNYLNLGTDTITAVTSVREPLYNYSLSAVQNDARSLPIWGFGAIDSGYHILSGFTSPGIFSFLKNYDPDVSTATYENYAQTRNTFLTDAPTPSRFLAPCVNEDGCDYTDSDITLLTFHKTPTTPEDIYTAVPADTFTRATKQYSINHQGGNYYATWDWAQPAYCRQQLLALGFSEADLTP